MSVEKRMKMKEMSKKNVRQNRRVDDENVIFYTICILSNLIFIFKFPKYYV